MRPTLAAQGTDEYGTVGIGTLLGRPAMAYTGPGMKWSGVQYSVPSPFPQSGSASGTGHFIQLISANRFFKRNARPNEPLIQLGRVTSGALDVNVPYPYGSTGNPSPGACEDTPAQFLNALVAGQWWVADLAKAEDSFKTYAMYQPPSNGGRPTVPVPMAKLEWKWRGEAVRRADGGHDVSPGSSEGSGRILAPGSEYEEFPQWTNWLEYGFSLYPL